MIIPLLKVWLRNVSELLKKDVRILCTTFVIHAVCTRPSLMTSILALLGGDETPNFICITLKSLLLYVVGHARLKDTAESAPAALSEGFG